MKYLIVGLGNPGSEYVGTRHNIGFEVMNKLADEKDVQFSSGRHGSLAELKHKGRTVYLLKPSTFMNLSGKALRYWKNELKIDTNNILVVTDDIAIPLGKLRMKGKGSAGGHNGLKNIEELLGSREYPRLRFGVGSEFSNGKQVDFVLGRFSPDEEPEMLLQVDKAVEMILSFATLGIERTMNLFN